MSLTRVALAALAGGIAFGGVALGPALGRSFNAAHAIACTLLIVVAVVAAPQVGRWLDQASEPGADAPADSAEEEP